MRLNDIGSGKLKAEHLHDPQIRQDILDESNYAFASDAASHMVCLAFEALEQAEQDAQDARTFPLKHRGEWTYYRMYHDFELALNTETGETDYEDTGRDFPQTSASALQRAKTARKSLAKVKNGGPYSPVVQLLDEWIQARTA